MLKTARIHYNALCKNAKIAFYHDKLQDCSTDPKSLYRITNELLHKKQDKSLPTHANPQDLARDFSEYFIDKIKNISVKFDYVPVRSDTSPSSEIVALDHFSLISEEELKKLIMSGNSKSCQLDPLPTTLLKACVDSLLPFLARLLNSSIEDFKVPARFKAATVTPLLKKSTLDKEDKKNYRPVSNLSYISKLLEKVVVKQLDMHMQNNSLYQLHQSAYRRHHSTETALVKICDDILCAMDKGQCTLLVMLDQSAAFDTINLDLLHQRLNSVYGITGSALAWLDSYFVGRTQSVSVSDVLSEPKVLETGFPQGSVLGPYMYPMYTSPLFDIAKKFSISMHMYADDTQLYASFTSANSAECISCLQLCVQDISDWMHQNHLKLNETKTEYLVLGSLHNKKHVSGVSILNIGGVEIQATESARNIGAVIDSSLSMRKHINGVSKSCYVHLKHISQIRPYLTREAAATLVNALITSRLDYVNCILYGLPQNLIRRLELIQNNAARVVLRKRKFDHVTPLLKELHWLPIHQRIMYKVNLMTYKALHGLAPKYIADMLIAYTPQRALRSSSKGLLQEQKSRLKTAGDRAFSISAPKLWNQLPEHLRTCEDLNSFKKTLKTYYFQQAYF